MEVPGGMKSLRNSQAVLPVTDSAPDAAVDSTESAVLQCGEVEDGEEVMRSAPTVLVWRQFTVDEMRLAAIRKPEHRDGCCDNGDEDDDDVPSAGDVCRPSEFRTFLSNFVVDDDDYWNTRGRLLITRGKVPTVGEAAMVEKPPVKRKHEEIAECGPASESELDEATDSDDESASSSDSDGSDSEYEQSNRRASANNKRRRGAGERIGTSPWIHSTEVGLSRRSSDSAANCDDEMKEMQMLLELQLKASEKREAGMKQRMETMMDMMSRHMGSVEKRVSTLEVRAQPQEQILERINVKLEKVMEQFSTLNENLSLLSACLSKDSESR